jgi:hypothetical protein
LKERNIFACGTVNPTRKGLPKLKEEKNMNRGDFDFIVSNYGVCVQMERQKRSKFNFFSAQAIRYFFC